MGLRHNVLTRERLATLLKELNACLAKRNSERIELILVGGCMLMLNGLRDITYDVDVFCRTSVQSPVFYQSILSIAKRNSLPSDWCDFGVQELGYVVSKMERVKVAVMPYLTVYGVSRKTLLTMKFHTLFECYGSGEEDIYGILARTGNVNLEEIKLHSEAILPRLIFDMELAQSVIDTAHILHNSSQMLAFS